MKNIFCTLIQSIACMLMIPFKGKCQSISPSGIYGASNSATAGGISVNWVLGSLTPESMSVLPIVLVSFSAKLTNEGHAKLVWKTVQEVDNAGFEIEKSTDGKNFFKIGFIDGAGTSNDVTEYQFLDKTLETASYYRIKQLDYDGTYTYSRMLVVIPLRESIDYLLAYPNPSPEGIVKLRLPVRTKLLRLADKNGRVIQAWRNPAGDQEIELPATGVYLLTVETSLEINTIKLLRQ